MPELDTPTGVTSAVRRAEWLRDVRHDDAGAARALDRALQDAGIVEPDALAYALLVRMELAERIEDTRYLAVLRNRLQRIHLSPIDRRQLEHRLAAPVLHKDGG